MGAALSSVPPSSPAVISQLTNEFHRLQQSASKVKAHQRKASQTFAPLSPSPIVSQCLTVEQLLQFQSPSHIPINFHSLSTLYALDLHGDGVLTLPLLLDFYQWCEHKCSEWVKTDRRSKLESLFTFKMFHDSHQLGDRHLVQWLCNLVATSGEVVARGGVTYVHRDSVMAAFTVFRAHLSSTVTFQQWFDQLQQIGETQVPASCVHSSNSVMMTRTCVSLTLCVSWWYCRASLSWIWTMTRSMTSFPSKRYDHHTEQAVIAERLIACH